ncbi:MAG: pyridoxal-phosphate dependent enzyme [Candidatus Kapaibacteriales bacterium]
MQEIIKGKMKELDRTVIDVIGSTPIIKLQNVAKHVDSEIYVKLEYMNPGGSIKERIAVNIIEKAIERGDLKPGGTIIEGTSGNTGVGLAMYAAVHGYKCIFVLPDKQSIEKINNLRAFGAKVVVTPTNVEPDDPRSYYSVAKRLAETTPNSFYSNQYYNHDNKEAHYKSTGPEILEQTGGDFDVFMCGVGTGGTITGTGQYLKDHAPHIKIVGVDIVGSILEPFWRTGEVVEAHSYVLEGIGEDIFPSNLDFSVIDDFVVIEDKESFVMTRRLLTQEGIYTGGSAGAAVVGAIKYAEKLKEPKKIVVILCDSGNRYTGKIFNDDWMRDNGYYDNSFNVKISEVLKSLGRTNQQLYSLTDENTIGDAVEMMKEKDISQIPVYSKGELLGVVSEEKILKPLYEGTFSVRDNIAIGVNRDFLLIDQNDFLEKVSNGLIAGKTVMISNYNKVVDILTDIDVLNFMQNAKAF